MTGVDTKPRVLVTGAAGMLGRAVLEAFAGSHETLAVRRSDCDLADAATTQACVESRAPQLIVHCAAWTDVDGCERDPARAQRDNADATRNVAEAARRAGAALCYISTDYVFDGGKSGAYIEDDSTAPINVYGGSKLAGEGHVLRLLPRSWIVRSSWLFGPGGRNFVRTLVDLLYEREEVHVVSDQVGCPTYTHDLARALHALVATEAYGVYHVTNGGSCSWHELATAIEAELHTGRRVVPCASDRFPRLAARPRNSVLANRRYDAAGLPPRRHWREALRTYMTLEWERSG
jgi:dTDP-4-dehydrorhamnose reductase